MVPPRHRYDRRRSDRRILEIQSSDGVGVPAGHRDDGLPREPVGHQQTEYFSRPAADQQTTSRSPGDGRFRKARCVARWWTQAWTASWRTRTVFGSGTIFKRGVGFFRFGGPRGPGGCS